MKKKLDMEAIRKHRDPETEKMLLDILNQNVGLKECLLGLYETPKTKKKKRGP